MNNKGIKLIKELLAELVINFEELSPCEHSKNVCVCGWEDLIERTQEYLKLQEKQNISKLDAWLKLVGNDCLKRAIEVAITGNHKITVIGNSDNGKEYLEIILGDLLTFISPCKCGNYLNSYKVCHCIPKEIINYRKSKKYQKALLNPIIVGLQTPPKNQYSRISENFKNVIDRINKTEKLNNPDIEDKAIELLNVADRKLGFTLQQIERVKAVAKTIAELDQDTQIKGFHMSEAIGYQISE